MWAAGADSRIEILLDEPIGTIAPEVYGQFTEHLGGVIYDGIWVGEKSSIPNIGGIRKEIVESMKKIRVPVVRWPGGCFADSYDWRDGVGPRGKRPTRTNFWADSANAKLKQSKSVQVFESNAFGTDEFIRFCKLSNSQPYMAANLRSLTPLDFDHWVEYCNSPAGSTTLAEQRAANGSVDPYNVKYWGVGNESWGCGGNFTPQEYATEFRRFSTWVPSYGVDLKFIGSGPNENDLDWSRSFFESLTKTRRYFPRELYGWSVHYYTWNLSRGKTNDWTEGKGEALNFDNTGWYEVLRQGSVMEQIVKDQWSVLGEFDPQHRVKLVVDEYGPWYRSGSEVDPSHQLGQQITLRDALHTAMTLDIFNRHADKVGMAACAQLVNCLNALFLTHEEKFALTPNYHVFEMYLPHQGAQAVRAEFMSPSVRYSRDGKDAELWGLRGSASRNGKTVTLTVVNPSLDQPRESQISLRGAAVSGAKATVLTSSDPHAHSTLEQRDAVVPKEATVQMSGGLLSFTFPPASVTQVVIEL